MRKLMKFDGLMLINDQADSQLIMQEYRSNNAVLIIKINGNNNDNGWERSISFPFDYEDAIVLHEELDRIIKKGKPKSVMGY